VSGITSAGVFLALVIAFATSLAGCGGSDAQEESAKTKTDSAVTARSIRGLSSPSVPGGPNADASGSRAADSTDNDESAANRGFGGKHGPRIMTPKGQPEPEPTSSQLSHATAASMSLSSPTLKPDPATGTAFLPANNTCDGKNTWPAINWRDVPAGTAELVLFVMNIEPVEEALFFDWAIAGIDPALTGLGAAELPRGAIAGRSSFGGTGYSICPPRGKGETYIFALYALPRRLSPEHGFDPTTLRKAVLAESGNVGLMAATYSRP